MVCRDSTQTHYESRSFINARSNTNRSSSEYFPFGKLVPLSLRSCVPFTPFAYIVFLKAFRFSFVNHCCGG